jgi:hypothetical protein
MKTKISPCGMLCIPALEMTDLNKTTIVVVISGVVEIATPLRGSQLQIRLQ